jgi:hypothetical protein
VKWAISVKEAGSTFEVWFIKGEVDHQCEGLSVGRRFGPLSR